MKGCIILQRSFSAVGNSIAYELQKRYGITEFCGMVFLRRAYNFINDQKDVTYTSILFEEEMHKQLQNERLDYAYLNHLEKTYGIPTLWEYITPDRTFLMGIPPKEYSIYPTPIYNHEELLRCLQLRFRTIIAWLGKEKPDFLICTLVGAMSTMILYHVAKKMGIKVITIDFGRLNNKVILTEDYKTFTFVETLFTKIQNKEYYSEYQDEAAKLLEEIRTKHISYQPQLSKPQPFKELKFFVPKNFIRGIVFLIKLISDYVKTPHKSDYTIETPWDFIRNKTIRVARNIRGHSDLYDKPNWSENFCYYQLHLEPELAISVFAPFYSDQIWLIRQIARSLPVGFKLYVREHRDMVRHRPRAFYKRLKTIPNVKLIPPEVDLFELINKSKLVSVITSTAGWEAALLGKPVITFGNVFYNKLTSVTRCEKIEDLPYIIKKSLESHGNDKELSHYLAAMLEESVDSDLFSLWFIEGADYQKIKDNPSVKNLTSYIAKKIIHN